MASNKELKATAEDTIKATVLKTPQELPDISHVVAGSIYFVEQNCSLYVATSIGYRELLAGGFVSN